MKEIPLSLGKIALVDDADYEWLSRWKWSAMKGRSGTFYASRGQSKASPKTLFMHRVILNPPKGIEVDHISGDSLDNRRVNLRLATRSQNQQNSKPHLGCASEFKGVVRSPIPGKWIAHLKIDGESRYLGTFKTEANAATAYNIAAVQHFGEFSRLNF